jgi:hypothetical protein
MSVVYYVLPVLLIVVVVVLSRMGQKRSLQSVQNMTPEQARERVNQYFASSFELQPGETLYAVWVGEEYQGEQSAARQVAGAALNQLSKAAIGVSTYVPQVQVGITSTGRVLVAREYSEMGDRGNFKQIVALGRGTRALDAATARPGEELKPPVANPTQRQAPPDFVQFLAPSGERYEAWMAAGQAGPEGFIAAFRNVLAQVPA